MSIAEPAEADSAAELTRLFALPSAARARIMVVVAHPDDETVGAGGCLSMFREVTIVHATDGAPEDMADANSLGFATRRAYALARRAELEAAMAEAGIDRNALHCLGVADQGAARNLAALSIRIVKLFREHGPSIVLTHAYEGGHPDHDAVAFAVHAATRLARMWGDPQPALIEMPLYRAEGGRMAAQSFAPAADRKTVTLPLSAAARQRKQRMFDCFITQKPVLASFQIDVERFRCAPHYDFELLPNAGDLYYEQFPWGLDGSRWLSFVRVAMVELGLPRCR